MTNRKSSFNETFTPLFTRFLRYEFTQPICGKRKNLDLLEVAIYGEFASFHLSGKKIYPTIDHLAEKFGVSRPTIITRIETLEAAGLISKKHRWNKSTVYTLIVTPKQFSKMCDAQGIQQDDTDPEGDPEEQPQQTRRVEEEQPHQNKAPVKSPEEDKPKAHSSDLPLMKRHRDEYGYCKLTSDEMNEAYLSLKKKYKGKKVRLSTLRDEIYGPEYMTKFIVGKNPGQIWREESYWHCPEDVFRIVNKLLEHKRLDVEVDKTPATAITGPSNEWYNVTEKQIPFEVDNEDGTTKVVKRKQLKDTSK